MSAEQLPTRRPYRGSCHCGATQYIVYLAFPPCLEPSADAAAAAPASRLRKCNCTVCHKMSFFHARPADPPRDFALLAPADPSQLAGYACNDGNISWSFCRACGVRCFAFWGRGERGEVRVEGEQEAREAWRPVASVDGEEWREGRNAYLSVNAATLEAGQEEGDLRVWHEKGWVCYLDCKDDKDENHFGRPAEGGMY